jgi:ABC-type uncharacterized transport system substrate-binding protein
VIAKRLRLLHDLLPKAVRIAILLNPSNAPVADAILQQVQEAAPAIGLKIQIFNATTIGEIDAIFERCKPTCRYTAGLTTAISIPNRRCSNPG